MNSSIPERLSGTRAGDGRVLIYLLSLTGGAGRNAVTYANVLVGAGHAVALVCGTARDEGLDRCVDSRVELHLLGAKRTPAAIPRLSRTIRRTAPSRALVIGPSNMPAFILASDAAGFRGEVILRVSDSPLGMQSLYTPALRLLKRWAFSHSLPRAEKVIALTHAMATELEQIWDVRRERIHYIPNGVELPGGEPERALADPPALLCAARLAPQKDHVTLLHAFDRVCWTHPCQLWLAGEGQERGRLENLARSLGIASKVRFLGHVRDLAPLYRSARLTILASRHEGFPNVLIEALSHGCPIVATDCPTGPAEIINSPEIGLLAEVGNPENLADRIRDALERSYDQYHLSSRAQHYSLRALESRIITFFSG